MLLDAVGELVDIDVNEELGDEDELVRTEDVDETDDCCLSQVTLVGLCI